MAQTEVPAKNKAFCILPWLHMYVDPVGDVFSCCVRSPYSPPLGNIHREKPEEIWNGPKFRELRRDFLAGTQRPDICSACYFSEEAESPSHRTRFNMQFMQEHSRLLSLTDASGHLSEMTLRYWDFRFSNTCNLKCRSCGPEYSTSWQSDARKLGWLSDRKKNEEQEFDMYEFAMSHLSSVEAIYFAGGEPLLMKEHFKLLNELIGQERTKVQLSYNSNFSTLYYGKHSILELWKNFENIHLSPSVDQLGAKAEYVRKGIQWNTFVENVKTVRQEIPWAWIGPTITVSIFNIMDIAAIHGQLMELNIIASDKPYAFSFNLLRSPVYYDMALLPSELKRVASERIIAYQKELLSKWNVSIPAFDTILRALKEDLTQHLPEFLRMTKALDDIRGEKFFEIFPEFTVLTEHV